ncbi:general transcription factor IIH subunit 2 isoform X3 [Syngnathus typhle]|uniref:general transcription factor IIH subunit 2 isoform X3 n=1 Tax=Syngnathus typhle TaxID=161592 RepID=UPI002A69EC45|nr:general transcription factor IIH subunit 2 isoform X3 [Syngnathus typhle]
MDEEPERTKRWEGGYERTWEILKEDESGSLKATVEEILFQSKRDRIIKSCGQIRLGMMRHLFVVIDCSRSMEDQDLKPNRLTATLKLMEAFIEEYFDQNPISQVGIIFTKNKRAEKLTDLSGNPKKHIGVLKKEVDTVCVGEPSLYNSLNLALQTLKHMPGHTSREILIILSSLTTCDPANIYEMIQGSPSIPLALRLIRTPNPLSAWRLTLVSAPHLARSFHHLFPLHVFIETPVENTPEKRFCESCQGELKDKRMFTCPSCRSAFCVECDHFIHDTLHCCPGCIHCQRTP